SPQQHTATPHGIGYPTSYTLSPFFSEHAKKAEKKYHIPLRKMIDDVGKQQDFHPCFIHSVVFYESGYNPQAASPCCVGLMQLGKAAAKETGVRNRRDPLQSLQGGVRYLNLKMNEPGIHGNVGLALASYNCGYGTIKKNHFKIPQRCWSNSPQQYVKKILSKYKECH
ncbi:MAG: lytic transglycosylase domain-containing protein, partial [Mariprofundaceae bacterium]|nr:lytic transglycosylase domain-containing protein [Mariprofundaceae bacterium]